MGTGNTKRNEPIIERERVLFTHSKPTSKDEIDALYSYESAVC